MKKIITAVAIFIISNDTMAQKYNLIERLNALTETVESATLLVLAFSAFLGLFLLVMSGIKLKEHSENSQKTPLTVPLVYLICGTLVFGLISTNQTVSSTIFGAENISGVEVRWDGDEGPEDIKVTPQNTGNTPQY